MPDVELVGVVDTKPGRAEEIATKYGTRGFTDAADVRGLVDAVTVAVPTQAHVDVALPFVAQGVRSSSRSRWPRRWPKPTA